MKKNLFLYLAAAVSCLLSCSDQADVRPGGTDKNLIRLGSATLNASLSSRSPLAGGPTVASPFIALVPSATTSGTTNSAGSGYIDGLHALGTMTFNGGSAAVSYDPASLGDDADVKAAFPVGNQVYLFGLYPANKEFWTLTNTTASAIFSGKDDLLAAPELLVKRDDVESGSYQKLAFDHLLTRLEVKLKAKTADAIAFVGSIKSIRLVADAWGSGKIKDQLTFTPGTGAVAFFESETLTALPFYKAAIQGDAKLYSDDIYASQSYELTTSPILQAYSLVAPVVADVSNENEYFLAIERGDGHVDYVGFDLLQSDNLSPFVGSTAGYSFSIVLTYSKEYIEAVQATFGGTIGSQDWKDYETAIDLTD